MPTTMTLFELSFRVTFPTGYYTNVKMLGFYINKEENPRMSYVKHFIKSDSVVVVIGREEACPPT